MSSPRAEQKIQEAIDAGDAFLNDGDFSSALLRYEDALAAIPEPRQSHPAALQVLTACGEALYYLGEYQNAIAYFHRALKTPGGIENPLLHLRFGQCYFEVGDFDRAADSLSRAYALEGLDIFDWEEDRKYIDFLASRIDM